MTSPSNANGSSTALVHYFIPSDMDDGDHPNAFTVSKPIDSIRLADIKSQFPLSGTYHFRFKISLNASPLWIDVTNDDSIVPQFNRRIVAKVLRVSWEAHDAKAPSAFPAPVASPAWAAAPEPAKASTSVKSHQAADVDFFGDSTPNGQTGNKAAARPKPADDFDLFG